MPLFIKNPILKKPKKRKREEVEDVIEPEYHSTIDLSILHLVKHNIVSHDYFIPDRWPTPKYQRGPNCGLYALETGLRFCYPQANVPPARKEKYRRTPSLRSVAKQNHYTSFGEIFDVESLQKLASHFGFTECETSYREFNRKNDYIDIICHYLKKGGCIVVAADVGSFGRPQLKEGKGTHWALVFGYYYCDIGCYFLVANQGRVDVWSATALFNSNVELPRKNPLYNRYCFYSKQIDKLVRGKEKYDKLDNPMLLDKRYTLERTLDKFHFGLCYIPSSVPITSLELDFEAVLSKSKRIK